MDRGTLSGVMQLIEEEMVTLAALMRHVMSFDGLSTDERRAALAEASRALGLLAGDVRIVSNDRAGYRDAAHVVKAITTGLDGWIERAKNEVRNDDLRDRATRVDDGDKRVAMLRAVEVLARHGGLRRPERLFLGWLAGFWGVPSVIESYELDP